MNTPAIEEQRTQAITMDPLPEYEIIRDDAGNKQIKQVLDRLRRNDSALKALTLDMIHHDMLFFATCTGETAKPKRQLILQAFDAIATNSSLKMLSIEGDVGLLLQLAEDIEKDRATRALSLNTSLNDIRIDLYDWSTSLLDIVMASPNLEFLTIRNHACMLSIEDIKAIGQVPCGHMNLHSLTIERLEMDSDMAAAFATAFQGNQTIKTLIMRRSVYSTSAVSLVEALPHDHNLEVLVIDAHHFNDDCSVRIVGQLCPTPLKVLSLVDSSGVSEISQERCTRIIQTLRETEHSLTKLDLFRDSQDSPWQNIIRLEIEKLTWNNRLQVERATWVDLFLEQDAPTKELLFLATKRAKRLDDEQFSKAPNMLFHLLKESPDFIVQAICDGHKMSSVTMSLPVLAAQNTHEEGLLAEQRPSIRNKRQRDED
jgi:hypothetical protein